MRSMTAPLIHGFWCRFCSSSGDGSSIICRCCRGSNARGTRPYVGKGLLEGNIELGGRFLRILAVPRISVVKVGRAYWMAMD